MPFALCDFLHEQNSIIITSFFISHTWSLHYIYRLHSSGIRKWKHVDWSDLSRRAGDLGPCFLLSCFKALVSNHVPKDLHIDFRGKIFDLHYTQKSQWIVWYKESNRCSQYWLSVAIRLLIPQLWPRPLVNSSWQSDQRKINVFTPVQPMFAIY